ncbi:MAG: amidohydrolase [Deltaproteobacteria bacterium]|nr:amidohydrolase [Deltaproteobacteria bacterium]
MSLSWLSGCYIFAMGILLKDATIVTINPGNEVLENGDLLIEGDRIAKILARGSGLESENHEIVDCRGKIVIPGLVSAHTHLTGMIQRGLWDETSFESWSRRSTATEKHFNPTPEDIYLIHRAACVELIRHGVTAVLNMFTLPVRSLNHVESACRAFVAAGMKGILALSFRDQSPDNAGVVPEDATPESWMSFAREAAALVRQFEPRVSFMLAPSAPQRCSDRLLRSCRELAQELNVGIHTHLAETKRHAEIAKELYGEPIVNHLEKIGFLDSNLSVAHAIWLDDTEIDILNEHQVKVAHNPSSNMKLGSGVARIKKMLTKGLTVGLGADSVNAGTVYSVFEQMKLAVLLPRTVWGSEDWVLPAEAFIMGTRGGAQALLLDGLIGSIEEGKKADLVILDPSVSILPTNHITEELALCENGSSVESVFVDGKAVLLKKRITVMDEASVISEFAALKPRIARAEAAALRDPSG